MSAREKVHTPRSMAAILNPDVAHPDAGHASALPSPTNEQHGRPRKARNLRGKIGSAEGSIELVLFRVADENFAVPLENVREAIDSATLHQLPDLPANVTGLVSIGGRTLPLYNGRRFLGVAGNTNQPSVLIMRGDRGDAGLAADLLLGSFDVELSRIKRVPALEDPEGAFVGVFTHEETLVALLDPVAFARELGSEGEFAS